MALLKHTRKSCTDSQNGSTPPRRRRIAGTTRVNRLCASNGTPAVELRLQAGYGLRRFAAATGFKPSNLSNTETGKLPPPQDPERLGQIASALGLLEGTPKRQRLYDRAARERKAAPPLRDAQNPTRPSFSASGGFNRCIRIPSPGLPAGTAATATSSAGQVASAR